MSGELEYEGGFTVKIAAQLARVSENTIRKLEREGKCPRRVDLGGIRRFHPQQFRHWLATGKVVAVEQLPPQNQAATTAVA